MTARNQIQIAQSSCQHRGEDLVRQPPRLGDTTATINDVQMPASRPTPFVARNKLRTVLGHECNRRSVGEKDIQIVADAQNVKIGSLPR